MDTSGDQHMELMEAYHYKPPMPSPPPPPPPPPPPSLLPSPWGKEGEPSYVLQQPRERRRGGRRGSGVKLSTDPQSVAARQRRHRISDRFRILKSLVPGGSKMDTVSMLEEAIHYVKFLKAQIWLHQAALMLPLDETPVSFPSAINATPTFISATPTVGASASDDFTPSAFSSSYSFQELPPQQILINSLPPPTPSLPPFPFSCFQDEEEILHQVSFNH